MTFVPSARLIVIAIAMTIVSCSTGEPSVTPDIELVDIASPTRTFSATAEPTENVPVDITPTRSGGIAITTTPSAIPTETPVPLPQVDVSGVRIPSCRMTDIVKSAGAGGTAPSPTATPVPQGDVRSSAIIRQEIQDSLPTIVQLAAHVSSVSDSLSDFWDVSLGPGEQGAMLWVAGTRLAYACSAFDLLDPPSEILSEVTQLADATRTRHTWISTAIDELQADEPLIGASELISGSGVTDSNVTRAVDRVNLLQESYNIEIDRGIRFVNMETLDSKVEIPDEYILSENGLQFYAFLAVEGSALSPDLLGPQGWTRGEGIRIRRLRNSESLSLSELPDVYSNLIYEGDIRSAVVDEPGITVVWNDESGWSGGIRFVQGGGFNYLVEWACSDPSTNTVCSDLQAAANSFVYRP